jgi:oligoribonuclease NrnB/cAMP/cGMP phosphodiesterase (DHH superfamily)
MSLFVWTDADMDGAGSYLLLSWMFKKKLEYRVTTPRKFRNDFKTWHDQNGDKYDQIFICDMDVSNHADLVDNAKIIIIDHHDSHLLNKSKYSKAKVLIKENTSCTNLIYTTYKNSLAHLSDNQILLIKLVDDYDSHILKLSPTTLDINRVYWGFTGDRLSKFVSAFDAGFRGFNSQQKAIISEYNKKLQQTISELDIHEGDVKIGAKEYKVVSAIADFGINDIAKYIIAMRDADIGIVININSGSVSYRRSASCNLSMADLASKLSNGGGHAAAAGGSVTDPFLSFTKSLHRI